MSQVRFRPLARSDLDSIWDYTADRWGTQQADENLGLIKAAIARVAEQGDFGLTFDNLYPGLGRIRAGSHLIYFLPDTDIVDVVRILHERRDAQSLI